MENTIENKAKFLNQNLKSEVVGDFSRYFIGTFAPIYDVKNIHGVLNGINKNESQQFDVDFTSFKEGFVFRNCFNELCRNWSHTIHAEHLSVIKTPLSLITDEDAIEVIRIGCFEDVYNCKFFANEDGLQWQVYFSHPKGGKNSELEPTPSFVVDYLCSKGYALPYMGLSVEQLVEYGWVKLSTQFASR